MQANELIDNPIFMKHWRSRMRPGQWLPTAATVIVLCLLIGWGGWVLGGFVNGGTFGATLALQTILFVLVGASQVSASVQRARASGILDFHRVSPLAPLTLALGFFFGAPIREYVLFALTIPLALFCVASGEPGFLVFVQIETCLLLVGWFLHALALSNALTLRKPTAASTAGGIVGVIVVVNVFAAPITAGFMQATILLRESPTIQFFGISIPWLAFVSIYILPITAVLLVAATRKMRSERAHLLSKPQAVGCLLLLTVLALGAMGNMISFEYAPLVVLYFLVAVSILLSPTITPSAGEYVRGIRRAAKIGRPRPRFWNELALNRIVLALYCVIVLVGSTLAWSISREALRAAGASQQVSFSLAIPIGIFVVAYFGLAYQFFALVVPRRAGALMGLFLFLVWLVPLVAGAIVAAAGGGKEFPIVAFSLSPIVGIALSVGIGDHPFGQLPQIAALGPAIGFAFLFNNLVVIMRRRIERAVHAGTRLSPELVAKPPVSALS
jgi:hypothetical protein